MDRTRLLGLIALALFSFWISGFDWNPAPYTPPEPGLLRYEDFRDRWIERRRVAFEKRPADRRGDWDKWLVRYEQQSLEEFRRFDANGDGALNREERLVMRKRNKSSAAQG